MPGNMASECIQEFFLRDSGCEGHYVYKTDLACDQALLLSGQGVVEREWRVRSPFLRAQERGPENEAKDRLCSWYTENILARHIQHTL